MWRISYKTMSLQEVLIMAYMNVLQAKASSSFPDHRAYEPLAWFGPRSAPRSRLAMLWLRACLRRLANDTARNSLPIAASNYLRCEKRLITDS